MVTILVRYCEYLNKTIGPRPDNPEICLISFLQKYYSMARNHLEKNKCVRLPKIIQ